MRGEHYHLTVGGEECSLLRNGKRVAFTSLTAVLLRMNHTLTGILGLCHGATGRQMRTKAIGYSNFKTVLSLLKCFLWKNLTNYVVGF